jgi:hypothetical protein
MPSLDHGESGVRAPLASPTAVRCDVLSQSPRKATCNNAADNIQRESVARGPSARSGARDIQHGNCIVLNALHDPFRSHDGIRRFRGIDQNIRPLQQRAQVARKARAPPLSDSL